MTIHDKAIRLREGGIVGMNADYFVAVENNYADTHFSCDLCDLDCLCVGEVAVVCAELNQWQDNRWFLKLASQAKRRVNKGITPTP